MDPSSHLRKLTYEIILYLFITALMHPAWHGSVFKRHAEICAWSWGSSNDTGPPKWCLQLSARLKVELSLHSHMNIIPQIKIHITSAGKWQKMSNNSISFCSGTVLLSEIIWKIKMEHSPFSFHLSIRQMSSHFPTRTSYRTHPHPPSPITLHIYTSQSPPALGQIVNGALLSSLCTLDLNSNLCLHLLYTFPCSC